MYHTLTNVSLTQSIDRSLPGKQLLPFLSSRMIVLALFNDIYKDLHIFISVSHCDSSPYEWHLNNSWNHMVVDAPARLPHSKNVGACKLFIP